MWDLTEDEFLFWAEQANKISKAKNKGNSD